MSVSIYPSTPVGTQLKPIELPPVSPIEREKLKEVCRDAMMLCNRPVAYSGQASFVVYKEWVSRATEFAYVITRNTNQWLAILASSGWLCGNALSWAKKKCNTKRLDNILVDWSEFVQHLENKFVSKNPEYWYDRLKNARCKKSVVEYADEYQNIIDVIFPEDKIPDNFITLRVCWSSKTCPSSYEIQRLRSYEY